MTDKKRTRVDELSPPLHARAPKPVGSSIWPEGPSALELMSKWVKAGQGPWAAPWPALRPVKFAGLLCQFRAFKRCLCGNSQPLSGTWCIAVIGHM